MGVMERSGGVASSQHLFLSCFIPEGRRDCWCRGGNRIVTAVFSSFAGGFGYFSFLLKTLRISVL